MWEQLRSWMVLELIVPPEMKVNAALAGAAAVVVGVALAGCEEPDPHALSLKARRRFFVKAR